MQNYGKKQHEKFSEKKKWICETSQIHKHTDYQKYKTSTLSKKGGRNIDVYKLQL
jgi:hypothetical protein